MPGLGLRPFETHDRLIGFHGLSSRTEFNTNLHHAVTFQQNRFPAEIATDHPTAAANALANGSGQAYANASAEEGGKKTKSREVAQSASQGKAVSASKKVDHLGIES